MFEKGKPLSAKYKKMISEEGIKKWNKFRAMKKVCDLIMTTKEADPVAILSVARGILAEHYKEK